MNLSVVAVILLLIIVGAYFAERRQELERKAEEASKTAVEVWMSAQRSLDRLEDDMKEHEQATKK